MQLTVSEFAVLKPMKISFSISEKRLKVIIHFSNMCFYKSSIPDNDGLLHRRSLEFVSDPENAHLFEHDSSDEEELEAPDEPKEKANESVSFNYFPTYLFFNL